MKTMNFKNIAQVAEEIISCLERAHRDNGESFIRFKDGSPMWMTTVAFDAHDGGWPSDSKYEMLASVLNSIRYANDYEDARIDATCYEPIYTFDLLNYLKDDLNRFEITNDIIRDGETSDLVSAIQICWVREKERMLENVVASIESHLKS